MLGEHIRGLEAARQPSMAANGFTLIEILIALTLGALVVLLAHLLFTGVAEGATRLAEARRALDREANGRRWLTEAFGSLAMGEGAGPFGGQEHQVEFVSWQRNEHGWLLRTPVRLRLAAHQFVAHSGEREITLADSVTALDFDYLLESGNAGTDDSAATVPGENAQFVQQWISPVSPPVAVRIRIGYQGRGMGDEGRVDTLLVLVGPRG